ncbi:MAG: PQQ-binding-like beta-propeller repeat protein [Planctomycetota bacterium]
MLLSRFTLVMLLVMLAGCSTGRQAVTKQAMPDAASVASNAAAVESEPVTHWPGFRGDGASHTAAADLPTQWTDNSLAWRITLPGYGQSSPIIYDGRVYITSVEGDNKEQNTAACYDLATGEVRWVKRFDSSAPQERTMMVSQAAPTGCVDEAGFYAFFESGDLVAFDHDGNTRWTRSILEQYGRQEQGHGLGSSLAQTNDAIIVLVAHRGPSYLLAIDKQTGKNRWKTDREAGTSWASPVVVDAPGGPDQPDGKRIITSISPLAESFDAETGKRVWRVGGIEKNFVPSPTITNNTVYIASSEPKSNLAIERGGIGDLSNTHIAWEGGGRPSGFGSPLATDEAVYFVNKAGAVEALDPKTGGRRWQHVLPEGVWASPVWDTRTDHLYFFCTDGSAVVLKDNGVAAEVIAENKLSTTGKVYGVAFVDKHIVLRTDTELIGISTR